jgi:hypothetical protein
MSAAMTAQLVTDALVMAIWRRAVPALDGRPWHCLLYEPVGQRLGQCGDGKLLLVAQDRTNGTKSVPNPRLSD